MADPYDLDFIPVPKEDDRPFLTRLMDSLKSGGWQDPAPGQRGTFVPSRINDQGKAEPAVPGIIQQPAESLQSLMTAPLSDIVRSGDRDAIRAASEASFDVASMLPAAGVAAGRVGSSLPMDKASRMARAKEMGFDTDTTWYHGTRAKFDAFEPSRTGSMGPGVYLTENAMRAENYAPGGNVLPTHTRGKFASLSQWQDARKQLGRGGPSQRDAHARQVLRDAGYDGIQSGQEVVVFDPSNIRSVNAAFDPAKKNSANLLASNADDPNTAAILAAMQGQETPKRPTLHKSREFETSNPEWTPAQLRSMLVRSLPDIAGAMAEEGASGYRVARSYGASIPGAIKDAITPAMDVKRSALSDWAAAMDEAKQGPQTSFSYDIMGANGENLGVASGVVAGDTMHFNWLGGSLGKDNVGPRGVLGVSGLRALREQVRKDFPNVKKFEGERVSGARDANKASDTFQSVKIASNPDDPNTAAILAAMTGQERPKGFTVYHGSPHDFAPEPGAPLGRFDSRFRHSGEGFTWIGGDGHNFASTEQTARRWGDQITSEQHGKPADQTRMYEAQVKADPEQFLDIDAPLPEPLRTKLANQLGVNTSDARSHYRELLASDPLRAWFRRFDSNKLTEALREQGVPGTRWLANATDRINGKGSEFNYVVYDDGLIDITRKFSNPDDPTTAAILALLTQQQGGQPQQ